MQKSALNIGFVSLLTLFTLSASSQGAVGFNEGPVVKGKHLGFVLSEPTDVEVSVLNSKGEIVRHLAAGVLGAKNPPPAPLKPGLKQILEWDGNDDKGKAAQGGPFSFRVRAGIKGEFDKFVMENVNSLGRCYAIAVAPKGQIYVFDKHSTANGSMGNFDISVFNRDGRYVRTLKPFQADIPHDRTKATAAFSDDDGRLVPRIHNWEQLEFYQDPKKARTRSIPGSYGIFADVDSTGRVYWLTGRHIAALDADGGCVYEDFLGPEVLPSTVHEDYPKSKRASLWQAIVGVSSDDKYVYISGMTRKKTPIPCVVRVPVADRSKGEVFVGDLTKTGTEGGLLTEPRGVASANGKLYVADGKGNRVVVFNEKDGSYIGDFSVPAPDTIGVNPSTGEFYVCSSVKSKKKAAIIKFDAKGKELYRGKVPNARGYWRIAVDASTDPVRIWMPNTHYGPDFTCFEDTGDAIKNLGDPRPDGLRVEGPRDLSYDRLRDELYVKISGERWHRFCGKTHKLLDTLYLGASHKMSDKATQLLAAEDGSLVTLSYRIGLNRWTRDAKPLNWEGKDTNRGEWGGIMTFTQNYLALHEDEIFFVPKPHYLGGSKSRFHTLNVMGFDHEERRTAVWQLTKGSIPRVDLKGNIYIASMVRDPDQPLPKFFDDKLPSLKDKLKPSSEYWYSYMYGGIVKFPPEGGAIWYKEGEIGPSAKGEMPEAVKQGPKIPFGFHFYYNTHETGVLQNAQWYRSGFAPYSETYPVGTPTCMCEGAGFDVDDWGRVFYPNLGQYRVEFIDNNNNWIGTFGHYGNADSIGGGKASETAYKYESSERTHPDIPLAWPTYVAVSDTHAYINDTISSRVVAVKLTADLTETVDMQ